MCFIVISFGSMKIRLIKYIKKPLEVKSILLIKIILNGYKLSDFTINNNSNMITEM